MEIGATYISRSAACLHSSAIEDSSEYFLKFVRMVAESIRSVVT